MSRGDQFIQSDTRIKKYQEGGWEYNPEFVRGEKSGRRFKDY